MTPTLLALAALWFAILALVVAGVSAVRTKARLREAERAREEVGRQAYLRAHAADLRFDVVESSVARLEMGQRLEQLTDLVAMADHEGCFPAQVSERLWRYAHELREEWLAGDGAAGR